MANARLTEDQIRAIQVDQDRRIKPRLAEIFSQEENAARYALRFCSHQLTSFRLLPEARGRIEQHIRDNYFYEAYDAFFGYFITHSPQNQRTIGTILEVLNDMQWEHAKLQILGTDWASYGVSIPTSTTLTNAVSLEAETTFPNPSNPDEKLEFITARLSTASIIDYADDSDDVDLRNYLNGIPLKVVVKRCAGLPLVSSDLIHKMTSKPRGVVLIINNEFKGDQTYKRDGCEVDEKYMVDLFSQLGFEIWIARNVPSTGLRSLMERYRRMLLESMDASVIIVMSHGKRNKLHMADHKMIDIDARLLAEMQNQILEQLGTGFQNKPKIFIFQACQDIHAIEYQDASVAGARYRDIRMLYPAAPGNPAWRNSASGSRYIWAIANVFMKHAHEKEIDKMEALVQLKMEALNNSQQNPDNHQIPRYIKIGPCKNLYFNPGL